jgi:hypothetical protein
MRCDQHALRRAHHARNRRLGVVGIELVAARAPEVVVADRGEVGKRPVRRHARQLILPVREQLLLAVHRRRQVPRRRRILRRAVGPRDPVAEARGHRVQLTVEIVAVHDRRRLIHRWLAREGRAARSDEHRDRDGDARCQQPARPPARR